eukprot:750422-Hanusia_phi.AAC.1
MSYMLPLPDGAEQTDKVVAFGNVQRMASDVTWIQVEEEEQGEGEEGGAGRTRKRKRRKRWVKQVAGHSSGPELRGEGIWNGDSKPAHCCESAMSRRTANELLCCSCPETSEPPRPCPRRPTPIMQCEF